MNNDIPDINVDGNTWPDPPCNPCLKKYPGPDDPYPLRDKSEDPRYALIIVWIWLILGNGLFLFFIALTILGFWYD